MSSKIKITWSDVKREWSGVLAIGILLEAIRAGQSEDGREMKNHRGKVAV